jgi:hypothetical protein
MKQNMRCQLAGEFVAGELGRGAWRLSQSGPGLVEVWLGGVDPQAAEAVPRGGISGIAIEWREGAVLLQLTSAGRQSKFAARSAIVHQPLPDLYDALPLAAHDEAAGRFWRRIFRLVRLPGGRYLLGIVARRRRKGP